MCLGMIKNNKMAAPNPNKLSAIYDKRQKDFVIRSPRRGDGALIYNNLLRDQRIYTGMPDEDGKYYYMFDFLQELEKRGYDITTFRFSVELKEPIHESES